MHFVKTLHKDDITIEEVRLLYNFVCNNSDGVDVSQLRLEYGFHDDDETLWKWYRGIFWETKSKLTSSFAFCWKGLQIVTIFGIRGEGNVILRQGTNEHLLMEEIYAKLSNIALQKIYLKRRSIKKYISAKLKEVAVELIGGNS